MIYQFMDMIKEGINDLGSPQITHSQSQVIDCQALRSSPKRFDVMSERMGVKPLVSEAISCNESDESNEPKSI